MNNDLEAAGERAGRTFCHRGKDQRMGQYESSRELVVSLCRTLLERGYLKATEGNVSVRIPGRDALAITPSSLDYVQMLAGDVCVLDYRLSSLSGSKKASIEAGMHAAVYQQRADVNVIIHTHQPYASALALIKKPIPALFDEQVRFLGRSVEIIPYAPSGTSFLRRRVRSKVANGHNAYILANHGVLIFGTDVEQALHNMALLEKCALDYLLALVTEQRATTIPLFVREIAFKQLRDDEKKVAEQVRAAAARSASGDEAVASGSYASAAPATPAERAASGSQAVEAAAGTKAVAAAAEVEAALGEGGAPTGPARAADAAGAAADGDTAAAPAARGYAISEYPNVDAVYARLNALVRQPLRRIRRDAMAEYLDYFETSCRRSKELTDEAREYIPGGVQHNLAFNYPFPIAVERAEGAHLWDADGNRYIDFLQAGGPTMLGSNYAPVREKVTELLQSCGPVTGLFHEYELKLAELLHNLMPSVEMFRMFGSGTEAVMAALRAARTATGKRYVVKMGGAYHGWSDQMVYGLHVPGTRRFESKGIPRGATARTCEVYPNDIAALRRKLIENRARGGTAAVIVEPVGPESGTRPLSFDYNRRARELCDEFGALLIFDEVVTGFRLGLGGAQGYFGVKPDLTVFGKCISGGYPMAGGVGGRADVMMRFAAGIGGMGQRAYVGGTLSANPLSCAAGYFALLEMERTGAPMIAGRAGDRLTKGLTEIIERLRLPFVAYNQGSIVHLETSGTMLLDLRSPMRLVTQLKSRTHMMKEMGAAYMASGVITLAGSRMYTSMADTDEVIDDALQRFERVLSNVERA
jgi:glutamate-1-semialdehyde 2,1-aminomutase